MKSKIIHLSIILTMFCSISFAQELEVGEVPQNPKTEEVLSQTTGEKFNFLADWNEVCNLFLLDFSLSKDGPEATIDKFILQWLNGEYLVTTRQWKVVQQCRNFEIDDTKNSTVSLDVKIIDNTYTRNYFAGLIFGNSGIKNPGLKYAFLLGKNVKAKALNYKIVRTEFFDTTFTILAEGEFPNDGLITGQKDEYNKMMVKRNGDKFIFSINNDVVKTLTINKAEISTKNIGMCQFGKNLKVGYDNLQITATNAASNSKEDLPKSKSTSTKLKNNSN